MSWTEIGAILGGASGLLGLWWKLARLRANDLQHLEVRLARIEEKLDAHLSWHLDHPSG